MDIQSEMVYCSNCGQIHTVGRGAVDGTLDEFFCDEVCLEEWLEDGEEDV